MRATLAINRLKGNVKQNETKELVVPIVVHSYFQNLKCNVKNTMHFSLNFGWYSTRPGVIR